MKTKMKVQEYLKRILSAVILFVLFFPALKSEAAVTQEEAGAAIASFAIDFYNKYGDRVHYTCDNYVSNRAMAYKEATVGSMEDYWLECVGWVSYAVHHATGLHRSNVENGSTGFVIPTQYNRLDNTEYGFEDVTGEELLPGDILANSHHVMVYVGDDKIIHSNGGDSLSYDTFDYYGSINYAPATYGGGGNRVYDKAYRISSTAAASIDPNDLAPIISGLDTKKKKDYNYYGLPKQGEYVGSRGTVSLLKSIINVLSQIADYLIGLMTLGIKIQVIGWTTLFENLVTDVVNEITGTEIQTPVESENPSGEESTEETDSLYTPSATETVTGFFTDKNDRLTIEKIIYNEVPLFDVNIFNVEEAGGQQLNPDGTLAIIKKNIAKWYYVFRNVAIIGLLLVLLYIGIRMAISTAASDKAVYKKYLKDWLVSFIIVFGIHYVMVFILNINEELVKTIKNSFLAASGADGEYFLYETVRTKAYELKFTSGVAGTIMYVVLVYLMIKYIFIYMKRYLAINILAVIAPIIGITYSIDKIKDSKSQSLSAWLQDFTFTTLLQSVHALVYTIFIPIALQASEENIGGIIFSFILLNFMAKSDKIITNIFGMTGGKSLSNILKGDTGKNLLTKVALVKSIGGLYVSGAKFAGRAIKGVGTTIGQIGGIVIPSSTRYRFNRWYNDTADNILGENNFLDKRRTSDIQTVSGIDEKIKAKKLEARKAFKGQVIAPFRVTKNIIKGAVGIATSVPAIIIEGGSGVDKFLKSVGTKKIIDSYTGKKKGQGSLNSAVANTTKKRRINLLGGTLTGMTLGAVGTYTSMRKEAEKEATTQQGRFSRSISMLEKAKSIEESIISRYGEISQSVNDRLANNQATSAAAKVPGAILAKLNDQYDKMIEEIFKEVDESDIQATIEEYIEREKTTSIKATDIDTLIEMLQERLDKKEGNNIEIDTTELRSSIDEAMEDSLDESLLKGFETTLKKDNVSIEDIDAETEKKIITDIKALLRQTDDEQSIIDQLDRIFADNGVTETVSSSTKKSLVKNLKRRFDNKKEKSHSPREIVDVIKKGFEKKETIKRESPPSEFEEIAQDMENLRDLNNKYGKDFGQKIYTKEELIKAMKETKRAKKFDLYDSIMKG